MPNLDRLIHLLRLFRCKFTLFPDNVFCKGMSSHHACSDWKSSRRFTKAWAYLCRTEAENKSSGLLSTTRTTLRREATLDPRGLHIIYPNDHIWIPAVNIRTSQISLKILSDMFQPLADQYARAIFELKRVDLTRCEAKWSFKNLHRRFPSLPCDCDIAEVCTENALRASFSSMAAHNNPHSSLKLHELCRIAPPPSSPNSSFCLTFFDLLWLRFHPVERLFFFSVPQLQPSSFFDSIVPKLKSSLSLTLHHFLPLAGNIVWPSEDSLRPIIQYTPGDAVSLAIAISDSDFNHVLDHSPRDASQSRAFVPSLDSSDSSASALSLQITLFPNSGFCIGMTTHHACSDGKSSTMFIKAWAHLCRTQAADKESSGSLPQELEPFLDREVILDPHGIAVAYINGWSGLDPSQKKPSLKILSDIFSLKVEGSARATFELKRGDLEKINKMVLQKWEKNHRTKEEEEEEREDSPSTLGKPPTLSTFVLTYAYVLVCIAKATEKAEQEKSKMLFGFQVDCRNRLEPPISENYFGNCVITHIGDAIQPEELTGDDGVAIVAKKIHRKISEIQRENSALDGAETLLSKFASLLGGENGPACACVGVAGSTRFGVYRTDFGWGRPEKVEITSVDRNVAMAMAESKDGGGGVEVGLVLNNQLMDQFASLFRREIERF